MAVLTPAAPTETTDAVDPKEFLIQPDEKFWQYVNSIAGGIENGSGGFLTTDEYKVFITRYLRMGVRDVAERTIQRDPKRMNLFCREVKLLPTGTWGTTEDQFDELDIIFQDLDGGYPITNPHIWRLGRTSIENMSYENNAWVQRVGVDIVRNCREISSKDAYQAADEDSLKYATDRYPVYYRNASKIYMLPDIHRWEEPEADFPEVEMLLSGWLTLVEYDKTVTADSTRITYFPDNLYGLVMLYTSMKVIHHRLMLIDDQIPAINVMEAELDSIEVPELVVPEFSYSDASYTSPESDFELIDFSDLTSRFPSYTKIFDTFAFDALLKKVGDVDDDGITLTVDETLSDLSVDLTSFADHMVAIGESDADASPLAASLTITDTGIEFHDAHETPGTNDITITNAMIPAYTGPIDFTLDWFETTEVEDDEGDLVDEYVNDPRINKTVDWSNIESKLQSEDVELAGGWNTYFQNKISSWQQGISDSLNIFNKENTEFQSRIQTLVNNLNLKRSKETQDITNKLSLYAAHVQEWQAETARALQEWSQNIGQLRYEKWKIDNTNLLQKATAEASENLNKYNEEVVEFQAYLQKAMTEQSSRVAKIMQEMQTSGQMDLANKAKDLEQQIQDFQGQVQKYQGDLSLYQNKVQRVVQKYQLSLQRLQMKSQTLTQQYNELKQQYYEGLQADDPVGPPTGGTRQGKQAMQQIAAIGG